LAYRIAFKSSVSRDLKRLGKAESSRIFEKIAADLPKEADSCPELKGKFAGLRGFRVGEFRMVFAVIGDCVLVTRIGHRKDVYKS